ncbi:helix-turn-helix transcriptional regulator [Streptomyces sp. NBC_01571]|uniref:helix-turn-helix domain-containing protein n=1 Tax=Streptomyces sp. NBC_01571 TaxID=2975883 RepID=UPI0022530C4D|nr:helix-turn-helix transcriptional regulator [Streptomyces sp. NBC_01571]MCX4575731.1 helix-turn-helix transcriptional regulator [Streptomyces sp. NBC_01571]
MGRRLVGELLRIHRGRLGLTQKDAADLVHVSESCFGAYERAERIPTIDFLRDVDKALDARGALIACVEMMEEEKYPPAFVDWVRLERQARVISGYETMLIPGLLQTEAYVRALYEVRRPAYTEEEIEKHVEARLERQAVLAHNPPPYVSYVIEEAVLERPLGDQEVLREQLLHMLECNRTMKHLTIQVMPTVRRVHAGLVGPMQLMSTHEGRNLVYAEAQGGGRLIHKSEQVSDLFDLFGMLRAQAFNPEESAELIERKAGRL